MMRIVCALFVGAALAAGVPAAAKPDRAERAAARLADALKGRVAGAPVRCVSISQANSSEIIDGTAIIYQATGGLLYVNTPPTGQRSLRRDRILVTDVWGGQLCRQDVVRLADRDTGAQTGFVVLGDFVPYTKAGR